MNNYYDNLLIKYVESRKINYKVISNTSDYIENMNNCFPFVGERIDFSKLNDAKYVKSDQENISYDSVHFIENLIDTKICSKDDVIIYIGDSLTENGYELYLSDLLKIISFLVSEIPQHHYFLFKDFKNLSFASNDFLRQRHKKTTWILA